MGHRDGRPQIENLFAREITRNLQLLCWDRPSDPTVLAYQVWASDSLNEKRPELSVMDERHLYVESFPDFGDGRHYLLVYHDLPAVYDAIAHVRAINGEHHSDPPTHSHFAADYKIVFDGQAIHKSHDPHKPKTTLTVHSVRDSQTIDLFADPGMLEVMLPCQGAIEEVPRQAGSPYVRLFRVTGGSEVQVGHQEIRRALNQRWGGNFSRSRQAPDANLAQVLQRPIIVPAVKMGRGPDGRLSVTPYAEVNLDAERVDADDLALVDGVEATMSGEGMEPITTQLPVIKRWTDEQGQRRVKVSAEGQMASWLHAHALAADRRERGEIPALV